MKYKRTYEKQNDEPKVIAITANYACDCGLWVEICDEIGIDQWVLNEGKMSGDEWIYLTKRQANNVGLI
jgi:hypothetical protein